MARNGTEPDGDYEYDMQAVCRLGTCAAALTVILQHRCPTDRGMRTESRMASFRRSPQGSEIS